MNRLPILPIFTPISGTMKHTRSVIFILLFTLLSLSSQFTMAQMVATDQPFDSGAGTTVNADEPTVAYSPGDPCTSPDVLCPIDGGLAFLIAAGIGLAGLRMYRQKLAV